MKRYILCLLLVCVVTASAQWSQIPQFKYARIYCMLATSDSTIFIGGDGETFARSTDAGTTWTTVMGNGIEADTILSLVEGCGYLFAGSNGVGSIYRSTNNGATWTTANNGLSSSIAVRINQMKTTGTKIIAASNVGIYQSADSGGHWQLDTNGLALNQIIPGLNDGVVGVTIAGTKAYTIKSQGGSVYSSPLDTFSWARVAPDNFNAGYAIASIDSTVFIATLKGIFVYNADSTTWRTRNNGLLVSDTVWLTSCYLTTNGTSLFAYLQTNVANDTANGLFASSDKGITWKHIDNTLLSNKNITSGAINEKYFYVGTSTAGAWRIAISNVITSVQDNRSSLPAGYLLSQNYPNPFNPSTVIGYQLAANGSVSLKVFDVLGREVATLVNERQSAGNHQVTFNASKLASGVYFYKLQCGSYTGVKKLVLMK